MVKQNDFPQHSCHSCTARSQCLYSSVEPEYAERFEAARTQLKVLQKDDPLFHMGTPFDAVYLVRSGLVKTIEVSEIGVEHVTGFYLRGEVIGLDAIADSCYTSTAVALETSSVCVYPFAQLTALAQRSPGLQYRLWRQASGEILSRQKLASTIGHDNSHARVAGFLLVFSGRLKRIGQSTDRFRLPISRQDMATYLGLSVETVCRSLTRLQDNGIIKRNHREITLENVGALMRISHGGGAEVASKRKGTVPVRPANRLVAVAG